MGQPAEKLLEIEELGGIGLGLFRSIGISLGKGIALELVVAVLRGQG